MANAVFLSNPSLNDDDVTVTASSTLGRRVGDPVPFAGNSNLMTVQAIGDPGDDLARDVEILGSQKQPFYSPYTTGGAKQYTDPTTYATLGTITAGASARVATAVVEDRLIVVVADGTTLTVYRWSGSAFVSKATATIVDSAGGISAAAIGENVYIGIGNNTDGQVDFFRYNDAQAVMSLTAEGAIATTSPGSIALATSGGFFVLLVEKDLTAGNWDTEIWFGGSLSSLEMNSDTSSDTMIDKFGTAWSASSKIRMGGLTWNQLYGFVAAFRVGGGSPGALRLARSEDGEVWTRFKDIKNDNDDNPTVSTGWALAHSCAVTVENRRVYVYRVSGTQDGAPANIVMHWFNGQTTWSGEVDVDGGVAVSSGTALSAVNWRGAMYVAWRNSATQITVRRGNALTTTNTTYYRELRMGEPNYVAGPEDDSQTALFFTPTGRVNAGDKWRFPAPEYDHEPGHVLTDFLSQVWRVDDNGARTIDFDAGSGRAFVLDAIAIFGSNLPSLTVKLDDDPAFGSPSTDQVISATIQTATVTSVDRNRVVFAANTFKPHEHRASKRWVRFTAGITAVFQILDNTHDSLIIDGNANAGSGSVTIFGDRMGYLFSAVQTPQRYLRLLTPSLVLPDDYYEIGRVLFGLTLVPTDNYGEGFGFGISSIETATELKSGARFLTRRNHTQRRRYGLPWRSITMSDGLKSLIGLYGLVSGAIDQLAFWPEPTAATGDQPDVYLARVTEPFEVQHREVDIYEVGGLALETEV